MAKSPAAIIYNSAGTEQILATEAKLEAVRVLIEALGSEDFATEATLASFLSAFNGEDFASQTTLAALLAAFGAEDFSTETTLAALKAAFDAEDFASQTTLAALLAAFNGEDFSTETTLAAADAKLTTIDAVLDSIKDTDGIKKITDQLPAGTNEIGKVAQGTPGLPGDAWPVKLASSQGDQIRADEFNRLYVAQPASLIDYYSKYGLEIDVLETDVVTGGTVVENVGTSSLRVGVTGTSGSAARLITKKFFRYQAGRGQDAIMSGFHLDAGQANQVRRWGYFTPHATTPEGLFFQLTGTTLQVARRSNVAGVADETIDQSSWNLDKLDGTGPSGLTIDITKGQIWEISFQWLGVGVVTFRVSGVDVHRMDNRNLYAGPYMRSGNHPMCAEIVNTGASTTSYMSITCFSVTSQGGQEAPLYTHAAQNASGISVSTTPKAILAIRPSTLINSVANRTIMIPSWIEIEHTSGQLRWHLLFGGSLAMTGGTWVSTGTNLGAEYNTTMTGYTGGFLVTGGFIAMAPGSIRVDLTNMFNRLGSSLRNPLYSAADQFALIAVKDSGGTTDVRATMTWGSLR